MAGQHKDIGCHWQAGRQNGGLYPDDILPGDKQKQGRNQCRMQDQPGDADAADFRNGAGHWLAIHRGTNSKQRHRRGGCGQHAKNGVQRGWHGKARGGEPQTGQYRYQQRIPGHGNKGAPHRGHQPAPIADHESGGQHQQDDGIGKQHKCQRQRSGIAKGHDGKRYTHIAVIRIGNIQSEHAAFHPAQAKAGAGQQGGGDEDDNGGQLIPPDKAPIQNIRRIAGSHIDEHHRRQGDEEGEF